MTLEAKLDFFFARNKRSRTWARHRDRGRSQSERPRERSPCPCEVGVVAPFPDIPARYLSVLAFAAANSSFTEFKPDVGLEKKKRRRQHRAVCDQ